MPVTKPKKLTQKWQCTYCGCSKSTSLTLRPAPGNCPRKERTRDGKMKPHSWVKVN